jgi:long-chain acyl-CoA synthetase
MNVASLGIRNIETTGERVSLYYEDRKFTNVEMHQEGQRLAAALKDLGLGPDDRAAALLPNSPELAVSYMSILSTGAVIIPMMFMLATPEVHHIFEQGAPKVVFTSIEFVDKVLEASQGLANPPKIIVVGGSGQSGTLIYEGLIDRPQTDMPIVDRAPSDLAVLTFTGGTTGIPKGVMLTQANLMAAAELGAEVVPSGPDDVGLSVLPLAHSFGMSTLFVSQLCAYPAVMLRWFTAEGFLESVQKHRVTTTAMVPTMFTFLLNYPGFDSYDLSSLKKVVSGAAALPVEVAEEFERRTGCRVLEGYGLTETMAGCVVNRVDRPRKRGSCGLAYPRTNIKIVDDDDRALAAGEDGEICVQGPMVMAGYYNSPEFSGEVLRGGWLHTGDIGHLDEDGYLFITERKKDLIIRGGFNIYPRDVEEVLYAHPAVAEAAVVGMPSVEFGEEVKAYVALKPGASATDADIIAFCQERLAKYKTPRAVGFLDTLPKSLVGKVLKKDLREMARREAGLTDK